MNKKWLVVLASAVVCCSFGCDEGGNHSDGATICVNNIKRCNGNDLQICANNNWNHVQTCTYGCDTVKGACNSEGDGSLCVNNLKRCNGKDLQICANNKWTHVQTCANGCDSVKNECTSDGGSGASCVNNEKRCQGNDLQVCANNSWIRVQTCSYGCDATNNECKSESIEEKCNNGDKRCYDGNTLQLCTGNRWSDFTCLNGCNIEKHECYSTDDTAECKPGEKKCDKDDLLICSNGAWVTTNCSKGCDAAKNECKSDDAGSVCKAGAKVCDQETNTIKLCSDNKWVVVTTCASKCDPETIQCVAECNSGERQCVGNNLRVCFDSKWQDTPCAYGCDTEKKECYSSAPGITCPNGEKRCAGNTLQTCANSAWQNSEECEYGCDSVKNECKPKPGAPVCSNGEKRCNGDTLQSCSNDKWQDSEKCEFGCDPSKNACNPKSGGSACEAGEARCDGINLLLCFFGNWVHGETCEYGCDSVKRECKAKPSVPQKCTPGGTNADCTPNCSADGSKGYYWQGSRVETVSCPVDESCSVDGSRVKCVPKILEDCTISSKTECKAACDDYTGTEGYYWSYTDNEVMLYECYENRKCVIDDIGHVRCVPIETGTACTATSIKVCDAACSADGKEGYYWSSIDDAVTVYNCYGDSRCKINEYGSLYCGLDTCDPESTRACKATCSADKTKAYYWNGAKVITNDCAAASKVCVMSGSKAICTSPTTGEACNPAVDLPKCTDSNTVKYCNSKANEFVVKACNECYIQGDRFFCDGDQNLKDCTSSSTSKCKGACDPSDPKIGWRWDGNKNSIVQWTCANGQKCSANKTGWLSCVMP